LYLRKIYLGTTTPLTNMYFDGEIASILNDGPGMRWKYYQIAIERLGFRMEQSCKAKKNHREEKGEGKGTTVGQFKLKNNWISINCCSMFQVAKNQ